jgi:hypothetical protein
MDSSVSPKDQIWFLRMCHHISNAVYSSGHSFALLEAGELWEAVAQSRDSALGSQKLGKLMGNTTAELNPKLYLYFGRYCSLDLSPIKRYAQVEITFLVSKLHVYGRKQSYKDSKREYWKQVCPTTSTRIYVYSCHAQCHCDHMVIVEGDQTTTPTATRYVYIANSWQKSPRQKAQQCCQLERTHAFLGALVKLRKETISFAMCLSVRPSVRPHGNRLPLNGFSRNFIFQHFSKICLEDSSFIKI